LFFPNKHQMFDTLVVAISMAACLYIAYRLVKAYRPAWFQAKRVAEPFVQKAMGPPTPSLVNTPPVPMPAPAPPTAQEPPQEPRVVSPGGPGAPNAAPPPNMPAEISPEAKPVDPYDDNNMEAPIHDSMRHPELSFGPGIDNKRAGNGPASGIANAAGMTSESPFSPEFAQNGGIFMGSVTANDMSHDDTYAVA
jgi:hypothetical protein